VSTAMLLVGLCVVIFLHVAFMTICTNFFYNDDLWHIARLQDSFIRPNHCCDWTNGCP